METEIGPRGYTITLKTLPVHFLENIKTELFVKPLENPNFQGSDPFPVFRISKSKVYLPRFYGIEKYGNTKSVLPCGAIIDVPFVGTLRDIQQQTIDATLINYEKFGGGLASLDTGLGKTVVALKLVNEMKVKTLIIVHAEFLLEQWKERIGQYLPTARVGIIRQNLCQMENVDITIAMLQTVIKREYPKNAFESYGQLIVDECFPGHTRILTNEGIFTIYDLYNLWKTGGHIPDVMSYNETTKEIETKKITHAWEKINKNLLKFSYTGGSFECTPNHKILTYHGYLSAEELGIGDYFNTGFGYTRIDFIEDVINESNFVYDIEVQDNHNFKLADFGPIVHNCHHIGSKTFSSIFYKVQPKYMLGLSATPDRKDGLSKVIYYFLGPQIVNFKRETGKPSVNFIFTKTENFVEKFNKLGKINNPTMITDLTLQVERNQLIIDLTKKLVKENRKILILSDRREHCELLLRLLEGVSAGVYLGGMKTDSRKTTTECSVIIGTYQASGEGFDVPELDTLILSTPKSDITQAIGRILRQKNKNEPVVYDIVDSFSIFKGQYYKRRKFYKNNDIKF